MTFLIVMKMTIIITIVLIMKIIMMMIIKKNIMIPDDLSSMKPKAEITSIQLFQ